MFNLPKVLLGSWEELFLLAAYLFMHSFLKSLFLLKYIILYSAFRKEKKVTSKRISNREVKNKKKTKIRELREKPNKL